MDKSKIDRLKKAGFVPVSVEEFTNTSVHKGFTGVFEYDEEQDVFYGHIVGIDDVITFQGSCVNETVLAMRDSVDDYLDFCDNLTKASKTDRMACVKTD